MLVIDIGKTNAKAALVDVRARREIDVLTTPNRVLPGPPYPHADADGLWGFILGSARTLHARHGVEALVATTHGCGAALVDDDGALVLPILDYEHEGPEELAAEYDALRPPFAETGTPRLPAGLNLGAQLFWQFRRFPAARGATVLPYPQYWAFRLSGVRASEVTSIGAHGDLWDPQRRDFSTLVERLGWRPRFPPMRRAADRLGPVTAEVAATTGLPPTTPVYCGIHDSNASLLPHLVARAAPFAVVSTGTWVISMAVGGRRVALEPGRDTLVNVNAFGDPVPSARFMGGREFARLTGGRPVAGGAGGRGRGAAAADHAPARGRAERGAVHGAGAPLDGAGGGAARRRARGRGVLLPGAGHGHLPQDHRRRGAGVRRGTVRGQPAVRRHARRRRRPAGGGGHPPPPAPASARRC